MHFRQAEVRSLCATGVLNLPITATHTRTHARTHLMTLSLHSLQHPLDQAQHRVALLPLRAQEANVGRALKRGLRGEEEKPGGKKIKAKIGVWKTVYWRTTLWMRTEVFLSQGIRPIWTKSPRQTFVNQTPDQTEKWTFVWEMKRPCLQNVWGRKLRRSRAEEMEAWRPPASAPTSLQPSHPSAWGRKVSGRPCS